MGLLGKPTILRNPHMFPFHLVIPHQALDKSRKSALSPAEFAHGLSSLVSERGITALLSGAI